MWIKVSYYIILHHNKEIMGLHDCTEVIKIINYATLITVGVTNENSISGIIPRNNYNNLSLL